MKRLHHDLAGVALLALAGCASAQTATWYATIETDDGDSIIEPGKGETSATITLWLDFEPDVDGQAVLGFASAGFDTIGGSNAGTGHIVGWEILNHLDELAGDLTTTDGVSLFGSQAGQINGFGNFTDADPIDVLRFTWQSDSDSQRCIEYEVNSFSMNVWVDNGNGAEASEWIAQGGKVWFGVGQLCSPLLIAKEVMIASHGQTAGALASQFGAAPNSPLEFTSYVDPDGAFFSYTLMEGATYGGKPITFSASGAYIPETDQWQVEASGSLGQSEWTSSSTRTLETTPNGSIVAIGEGDFDVDDGPPLAKFSREEWIDDNGKAWSEDTYTGDDVINGKLVVTDMLVGKKWVYGIAGLDPVVSDGEIPIGGGAGSFTTVIAKDPNPECPGDCDTNGQLNILDFVCYQLKFQANDPTADCNADGELNVLDFVCFQQDFQGGCPDVEAVNEDFENYQEGELCGQGGWDHWYVNVGGCATVVDDVARYPGDQSLKLSAFTTPLGDDTVYQMSGIDSGTWRLRAWTYVPSDSTGTGWFVNLNTYTPDGPKNWSLALAINATDGLIQENPVGMMDPPTLPLLYDHWAPIDIYIDLDQDYCDVYYWGEPLLLGQSWSAGMNAPGKAAIEAIHLDAGDQATGISQMYLDDISLIRIDQP